MAQREQLVGRLFVVAEGPDRNCAERSIQKFLFGREFSVRGSLHSRWQAAFRPAFDRNGRDDCRRKPRGYDRPIIGSFLDELWNTPIPSGEQRYYDGMLYIMSLMHCSGNFRIWGLQPAKP